MKDIDEISGYHYNKCGHSLSHSYLIPQVREILAQKMPHGRKKMFDLGCGNGSTVASFYDEGWDVSGVDPSSEGIEAAQMAYPNLELSLGSAYENLEDRFGQFPVVISLEVVEHVYSPRDYARTLFSLVEPGGVAVVSTPYHGYIKNVVLALTGKMDAHFTALWDHGHIKFWSISTLRTLLQEVGFRNIRFSRVGRLPILAKSMIAVAERPDRC